MVHNISVKLIINPNSMGREKLFMRIKMFFRVYFRIRHADLLKLLIITVIIMKDR
jgi:hypothetical protein